MVELIQETRSGLILSITNLLTLEEANISGGAYAMRSLSEEHIEALLQSDPTTWPPALVTRCREGYILIGGYHRREALKRMGRDEIRAMCQAFSSENDVIEAAFRDNLTHGLPASSETRSDYAYWLHLTYSDLGQEEIAARAGISQSTVSKAIARREKLAMNEAGESEEVDAMKVCRQFVKKAVKFVESIDGIVDPVELKLILRETIRGEDREKIVRLTAVLNDITEYKTKMVIQQLKQNTSV